MRFFSSAPASSGADLFWADLPKWRQAALGADTLPSVQPGKALLAWFDRHRRDLPWRSSRNPDGSGPDPYGVWISEIMLQQTRVETATPYYLRFLDRFPNLASLAAAEEADVLALWSGLGYYRRCRHLLAAARLVISGSGALPRTARELERLPGIGPYTAAAIASIAFGETVPVLDGNVERVLSRWLAEPDGARTRASRARLLEAAAGLLDPSRPGDSNQAMMELGATLCSRRRPDCPRCPLAASCEGYREGRAEAYPAAVAAKPTRAVRQVVALAEERGRWLLHLRSARAGQLASLWEFPSVELAAGADAAAEFATRFGGVWNLGEEIFRTRHAITDRRIAVEVVRAEFAPEERAGKLLDGESVAETAAHAVDSRWFQRSELPELPLTGIARKVLRRLAN